MQLIDRWGAWLTDAPRALHALAACRIVTGLAIIGLLASNFGSRSLWVGPGSIWAEPARAVSEFPEIALLGGVTSDLLTVIYLATILSAFLFTIGWHTKTANAVTLVGFIAIVGQNPVVGGQGDNVVRLTLLWLLLTQSGLRWSVDEKSHVPDNVIPAWLRSGLHHVGLIGLMAQTVLLFLTAGLNKVADEAWQHGNALYYTLQLPDFRPFPWLSDALSSSTIALAVLTYAVLFIQLFFAPLLLHDVSRRVVVWAALAVTAVAGAVFGEPWSALAVVAVTLLFVDDALLERCGAFVAERWAVIGGPVDDVRFAVVDRVNDGRLAVADRFNDWRFAVVDRLDDWRYRFVFPVTDWIADHLPWRR